MQNSGYWKMKIDPKDKEEKALSSLHALFQLKQTPFRFRHAPATNPRKMAIILALVEWNPLFVHLHDIFVFFKNR